MHWPIRLFALLLSCTLAKQASADKPVELDALDIPNVVQTQPEDAFLVVHYTSSLRSCGFCYRNNEHFSVSAQDLAQFAKFASVITDPWQDFRRHEQLIEFHLEQGLEMVGIPLVVVYQNGEVVWHVYGEQPNLSDMLTMGLVSK